ncbi:MAG: hypothetical protein ACR2N5_00440 [Solirubrobacterales bacterium]
MLELRTLRRRTPIALATVAILASVALSAPALADGGGNGPASLRSNPCGGAPNQKCGMIKVKQRILAFFAARVGPIPPPELAPFVPKIVSVGASVSTTGIKRAKHPRKAGNKKRKAKAKALSRCQKDINRAPTGALIVEIGPVGRNVPATGGIVQVPAMEIPINLSVLSARVTSGANAKSKFSIGKKRWVAKCVKPPVAFTPAPP